MLVMEMLFLAIFAGKMKTPTGESIDADGLGPFMHRLLYILKILVDQHAELNVRLDLGITPLHLACEIGDWSLIDLFLRHGANPSAPANGESSRNRLFHWPTRPNSKPWFNIYNSIHVQRVSASASPERLYKNVTLRGNNHILSISCAHVPLYHRPPIKHLRQFPYNSSSVIRTTGGGIGTVAFVWTHYRVWAHHRRALLPTANKPCISIRSLQDEGYSTCTNDRRIYWRWVRRSVWRSISSEPRRSLPPEKHCFARVKEQGVASRKERTRKGSSFARSVDWPCIAVEHAKLRLGEATRRYAASGSSRDSVSRLRLHYRVFGCAGATFSVRRNKGGTE